MKIENSQNYLFVLGREQKIALLELKSVLRRFCLCFYSPENAKKFSYSIYNLSGNIVLINITGDDGGLSKKIIKLLGGTIKIFKVEEVIDSTNNPIPKMIYEIINRNERNQKKIKFGLSDYTEERSQKEINTLSRKIKQKLRSSDRYSRYIFSEDQTFLSSQTSAVNKMDSKGVEIGIFKVKNEDLKNKKLIKNSKLFDQSSDLQNNRSTNQQTNNLNDIIILAKLVAVNDPREWAKRDYQKPSSDPKSGMTPPKLARMMVNLAVGGIPNNKIQNSNKIISKNNENWKLKIGNCDDVVIIDPFCGSGNILMEAMELGFDVVGSDILEEAVEGTRKNLAWNLKEMTNDKLKIPNKILNNKFQKDIENNIFLADATKEELINKLSNSNFQLPTSRIAFISEPYLGKSRKIKPRKSEVIIEFDQLKKIYLEFLKNISALHYQSFVIGYICLVFPLVETSDGGKISLFSKCLDEIADFGYNPKYTLEYGRDYQVIKREIVFLKMQETRDNNQTNSKFK